MKKHENYYKITQLYSNSEFDVGDKLLSDLTHTLSECEKLECQANKFFYKREKNKALDLYESIIDLDNSYYCSRYYYYQGVQSEIDKNYVQAFEDYQDAIEIEPTFVDTYIELGAMLFKMERFEGALQCFKDALLIEQGDLGVYENISKTYKELLKITPELKEAAQAAEKEYEEKKKVLSNVERGHYW